jgi:putative ABC transport system ATP-binding protein
MRGNNLPAQASETEGLPVTLQHVAKHYHSGLGEPITALDDINLDIPAGQALAVTGRSGSGKSSLLYLIGAIDNADTGTITVGDTILTSLKTRHRASYRRRIGFVFQRFHLLPTLTAHDNVLAPVLPYRTRYDKHARATDLLAAVGLSHRKRHLPSQMSGGEQQRVAIARALINDPVLLLADEPTGNLDTHTGTTILELLLQLRTDHHISLIIATHDTEIAAHCDRTLTLTDGKISDDQPNITTSQTTQQQPPPDSAGDNHQARPPTVPRRLLTRLLNRG